MKMLSHSQRVLVMRKVSPFHSSSFYKCYTSLLCPVRHLLTTDPYATCWFTIQVYPISDYVCTYLPLCLLNTFSVSYSYCCSCWDARCLPATTIRVPCTVHPGQQSACTLVRRLAHPHDSPPHIVSRVALTCTLRN